MDSIWLWLVAGFAVLAYVGWGVMVVALGLHVRWCEKHHVLNSVPPPAPDREDGR